MTPQNQMSSLFVFRLITVVYLMMSCKFCLYTKNIFWVTGL